MKPARVSGGRRLRFEIFRYNPEDPRSTPHMQDFELDDVMGGILVSFQVR